MARFAQTIADNRQRSAFASCDTRAISPVTRLDAFILRMQAQRACIDEVARVAVGNTGLVLELGLGNGRTYDHLRQRFAGSRIVVFDREIAAHPDCIPALGDQRLGDFRTTVPAFAAEFPAAAMFIHADIGSANRAASIKLAQDLAPFLKSLSQPGGYVACDQPVVIEGFMPLPLPGGDFGGAYHFLRNTG